MYVPLYHLRINTHVLTKHRVHFYRATDIKLNNNLVSESGTNYIYKALLEAMLTYDDSTKKIQLANEGFTGDSGNFAQINPDAPPFNH